jgi:hypothetical protein
MTKPVITLPVVLVKPSTDGMHFIDTSITLDGEKRADKKAQFYAYVESVVTDESSILLYKEDVKRMADQLSGKSCSSKDIFSEIKQHIRGNFTVLKLSFDPRSLQFNGYKTPFIIHKHL